MKSGNSSILARYEETASAAKRKARAKKAIKKAAISLAFDLADAYLAAIPIPSSGAITRSPG